jgi:hypothetical protein
VVNFTLSSNYHVTARRNKWEKKFGKIKCETGLLLKEENVGDLGIDGQLVQKKQ